MGTREILPARRAQILRSVSFVLAGDPPGVTRGMDIAAGYVPCEFPAGGRVIEVFVDGGFKPGSQGEFELNDQAVLASMLLQFGMTPRGLRMHLGGGDQGLHFGNDGKVIGSCATIIQRVAEELIDIQIALDDIWGPLAQQPKPAAAP